MCLRLKTHLKCHSAALLICHTEFKTSMEISLENHFQTGLMPMWTSHSGSIYELSGKQRIQLAPTTSLQNTQKEKLLDEAIIE